MPYSSQQLKLFAYQLTLRASSDSMDRMAGALLDAQVDLNPHQIDAALFATSNPLSKGAILADEVGLGKTIEAGLLLAQKWAERRRKLLIICPANLRKQWYQELADKFGLPSEILELKSFKQREKEGYSNPFESDKIIITSYQFAASKSAYLLNQPWDLVVVDEAHRLRNVYKTDNKTARTLRDALAPSKKVFLTATPLQNSLLELYGLVSFIDEKVFGDLDSFKEQFLQIKDARQFDTLKQRISPICKRTLRRQVEAYVKYTKRIPLLREFTPSDAENRLYYNVSEYLQRETLYALPNSQRQLITLVLRKLLASSTFAIAGALDSLIRRLNQSLDMKLPAVDVTEELDQDFEALDEIADEFGVDDSTSTSNTLNEIVAIKAEIAELEDFRQLAISITQNAKGTALLQALKVAFAKLHELGAAKKAIIFTESKRTQDYLLGLLSTTEYADGVVLFNGSNNDAKAKQIYTDWIAKHKGSDKVSGSRTADTRAALVDYFKHNDNPAGTILIATEAGAEGINLQFCSLVINYDLPWNPQRIEQRIGRCHRYGQKHDVVVVNFVNRENEADRRVYELLDLKFQLFNGVFGASDEVLGAVESGVDFERRIADIYQNCRHPAEIHTAFEQLQLDLANEISDAMLKARKTLLENFDEEVQERLKIAKQDAETSLGRLEKQLIRFTKGMLNQHASFDEGDFGFRLDSLPTFISVEDRASIPLGRYELPRRSDEAHIYRIQHPLAQALLSSAKQATSTPIKLNLQYEAYGSKVTVIEQLIGRSGVAVVEVLTVESLGATEDYLLMAGLADSTPIEPDVVEKLLSIPGTASTIESETNMPLQSQLIEEIALAQQSSLNFEQAHITLPQAVKDSLASQRARVLGSLEQRNLNLFTQESEKLDAWADDLKVGLEREIKDLDKAIKEARTRSKGAATLAEKLEFQKQQTKLEAERDKKRRELFDRQDEIQRKRNALIDDLEGQLQQKITNYVIVNCTWELN
ncbi:DEAD/DEAH box helicase family protein [Methylophilus sp. 13]|uniref:SNF2-related protein n=1 Tax=Methylophilus sp. 13 TaxID=2781018 RepID=UPI00188EFB8A|nr:SNF2-related protein [Methylophilus sp. 13]MBF5039364.1 DEAD/DEAH box helicase family protein [Methylophilus sp. 13]